MPREIRKDQDYKTRLLKLIPSEIVAAYLVLQGVVPEIRQKWGLLVVFIALVVLTPFYLSKYHNVKLTSQVVVATISFVIWVYSMGDLLKGWDLTIHEEWIGSVVLIIWTLAVPLIVNPKTA